MPIAANKGRFDIVGFPNENQIEGVTFFVTISIGGKTGELFELPAKFFFVFDIDDIFGFIQGIEIHQLKVGFEFRIGGDERKALDRFAGNEIDVNGFKAFIQVDKYEAGLS